jgi:thioredoxin-like negative regulator of GroEL
MSAFPSLELQFSISSSPPNLRPPHFPTQHLTPLFLIPQELKDTEKASAAASSHQQVDIDDLLDDPDLEALHAERLAAMKAEAEKRAILQVKGHGRLEEVDEGNFLEIVTKTSRVVCHFYHREFERCKVMDKHLGQLAMKHIESRFIKLSAPDAPFFVEKLNVRVLPCVVAFVGGVAVERVVGFEGLGAAKDDFKPEMLEKLLMKFGVVDAPRAKAVDSDEEEQEFSKRTVRQSVMRKTESDEDSDFD